MSFWPSSCESHVSSTALNLLVWTSLKVEQARQTINRWIEDQTENQIANLLPAGAISIDSKLVLTNAVYFHGIWAEPFQEDRTKDDDFHLTTVDKITVPIMHRRDEFRFGVVDDLQILELPYGDGSLSMIVLLPNEVDGLADLEARLTLENLQQWMASLKLEEQVKVYLPRFTTTSQFEMSSTLRTMGMVSAFDDGAADFSGMTPDRDLFISGSDSQGLR